MVGRVWWAVPLLAMWVASCTTTPRPQPQPVKLTLFGLGLTAGEQLRQDALNEFSARTGIQVDVIPTLGTSAAQMALILKLLRTAAAPDMYVIDVIWAGTLQKHLLDLTPYLTQEARSHMPALLENDTVATRVVSLPFYANAGMLYYRPDLLKKYGYLAPPETWEEMQRMALRIQSGERAAGKKQFWGYVWQGAAYEGLTCNAIEWLGSFGGGRIIENDGRVSVNNPRSVRALQNMVKWVRTISPESVLSYTEADALNVFQSGGAAFMRHWSSGFRGLTSAMPAGHSGIALLPAGPAGRVQTVGGFHLGVSRYSKHLREAASLALYLTGEEVQRRRALRRGYLPTRPRLYDDTELTQKLPELRVIRGAKPESWITRPSTVAQEKYLEVSTASYTTVHRVLNRQVSPGPALKELEQKLIQLMGAAGASQN